MFSKHQRFLAQGVTHIVVYMTLVIVIVFLVSLARSKHITDFGLTAVTMPLPAVEIVK